MEVIGGRRVKSVKEFLHLFPPPTGNDDTIKKSANVNDTIRFIQAKVPQTIWQTEKFAKYIKGKTLEETCSNIWHWLYEHIPYKRDEDGVEQIRSPRRVIHEGSKTGVDCDCYSFFISSCLVALHIPHKYRITKYLRLDGKAPRWQHIYIVVPKNGRLDEELNRRDDYIVLDCVKNDYDDEQPFIEYKDFEANMRLDYLDGIEDERSEYQVPNHVDARDLASMYDEEELGKLGQWLKKAVKNVGTAVKNTVQDVGKAVGTAVKAVVKTVAKVFPVTVVLRNAFLAAMKINFLNVAKRLRYAYLSDQQAQKMGMNMSALAAVRRVREKAENIFKAAGGNPDNIRLAILKGKGNSDNQVPLAGFAGLGSIDGHEEEIKTIMGLGEPVTMATITAAIPTVTALAAALKEIKDLFPKNQQANAEFASDADAGATAEAQTIDPNEMMNFEQELMQQQNALLQQQSLAPAPLQARSITQTSPALQTMAQGREAAPAIQEEQKPEEEKPGFFTQAGTWVKKNKLVVATGIAVAGIGTITYLVLRNKNKAAPSNSGLSGFSSQKRKRRKGKPKSKRKRPRIKAMLIRS